MFAPDTISAAEELFGLGVPFLNIFVSCYYFTFDNLFSSIIITWIHIDKKNPIYSCYYAKIEFTYFLSYTLHILNVDMCQKLILEI